MITYQRANYGITKEKEFEKSVKLLSNEGIIFQKECQIIESEIFIKPGILAITNSRIILLRHFFLIPDQLVYIPLEEIKGVKIVDINEMGFWYRIGSLARLGYLSQIPYTNFLRISCDSKQFNIAIGVVIAGGYSSLRLWSKANTEQAFDIINKQ